MASTENQSCSRRRTSLKLLPSADFPGPQGPDPQKMPEILYLMDCYPPKCKINSYSKPELLVELVQALEGTSELEYLQSKCFKSLFEIPVRLASFTGKLVHQMLCRSLHSNKKHELWFVFAGQPIRFSLKEFALVTGLDCRDYPAEEKIMAMQNPPEGRKFVADMLFGEGKPIPEVKEILSRLKRDRRVAVKDKMTKAVRIRLALLVIVEGVMCCSSGIVKPSRETIEMLRDLEDFESYPWGRKSFEMTMDYVKVGTKIPTKDDLLKKFSQTKWSTHGFTLALQLFILKSIPELGEPLYDFPESVTLLDKSVDRLQHLRNFHNDTIMKIEDQFKRRLPPYLQLEGASEIKMHDFVDELEDPKMDYLDRLIGSGFIFCKEVWKGGSRRFPKITWKEKDVKKEHKSSDDGGRDDGVQKPIQLDDPIGGNLKQEPKRSRKGKGKVDDVSGRGTRHLLSDDDVDKIVGILDGKMAERLNIKSVERFSKEDLEEITTIMDKKMGDCLDKLQNNFSLEKSIMKDELVDEILYKLKQGDQNPSKGPASTPDPTDTPVAGHQVLPGVTCTQEEHVQVINPPVQKEQDSPDPAAALRPRADIYKDRVSASAQPKEMFSMEGSSAPDMYDTGEWAINYGGVGSVLKELGMNHGAVGKYDDVLNERTLGNEKEDDDLVTCGQKCQQSPEAEIGGNLLEYDLPLEEGNVAEDNVPPDQQHGGHSDASKGVSDEGQIGGIDGFNHFDEQQVHLTPSCEFRKPEDLSSNTEEEEEHNGEEEDERSEEMDEERQDDLVEETKEQSATDFGLEDKIEDQVVTSGPAALLTPAKKSTNRIVESSSKLSGGVETCNQDTASAPTQQKAAEIPVGTYSLFNTKGGGDEYELPDASEFELAKETEIAGAGATTGSVDVADHGKHPREEDGDFQDPPPAKRTRTLTARYAHAETAKSPGAVDEGKRKKFVSKIRQGKNKEYNINGLVESSGFFTTVYTPTKAFDFKHVDVALSMISSKHEGALTTVRVSILDTWFTRKLSTDYAQFSKLKKKEMYQWTWNNTLKNYVRGMVPGRHSRSAWYDDADDLYCPMDWGKGHWVVVAVDLKKSSLTVLDPRQGKVDEEAAKKFIAPVAEMLPYLILASGKNNDQTVDPFSYTRPSNLPQFEKRADCGPVTVKFIELDLQGKSFAAISEGNVDSIRLQLAIDIFEEFVEPVDT